MRGVSGRLKAPLLCRIAQWQSSSRQGSGPVPAAASRAPVSLLLPLICFGLMAWLNEQAWRKALHCFDAKLRCKAVNSLPPWGPRLVLLLTLTPRSG